MNRKTAKKRHDRIVKKLNKRYSVAFNQYKTEEQIWLRHSNDRLEIVKKIRDAENQSFSVQRKLFYQLDSMNRHNLELYDRYNATFQKVRRVQGLMSQYLCSYAGKSFKTNFKF